MTAERDTERRVWWRTLRDAWLQPAGVGMLGTFGLGATAGIIWGVQLNTAVWDLRDDVGAHQSALEALATQLDKQNTQLARTAEILSGLDARLDRQERWHDAVLLQNAVKPQGER